MICFPSRDSSSAKQGFTLAEVLITLGVIGIVAALTTPVLVSSYQKKVTVNQLKTAYSVISEAVERAKLDYNDELSLSDDIILNSWYHSPTFSKKYIDPYLNGVVQYKGREFK